VIAERDHKVIVRLKPKQQSDTVPGLLDGNRQWRVSLKFNRGMLLENNNDALFIGSGDVSKGPYHLLLPQPQFALLRFWEVGRLVESRDGRLISEALVLESCDAGGYSTKISKLSEIGAAFGFNVLSEFMRLEKMPTGLGFKAVQILAGENVLPVLAHTLAEGGSRAELKKLVRYLVGRGQGLTPSGDDFLVGLMAVMTNWTDLYTLVELLGLSTEATTTVSRCYFRQALRGHFDHDLTIMVKAMNKNWRKALRIIFARIRAHGHSSGLDLLAGVLFALQIHCILS
jgi:Protein of unknown function (DUF2877).